MKKKMFFVSGLPRSGSTLFMNILNQNPRFYGSASSGLIEIIRAIRDHWQENVFCKAMPEPERTDRKLDTIRGALFGSYDSIEKPVIFEKNRGWPTMLELLSTVLAKENIKVIACVRDLRDILASFEKLYRKTMLTSSTQQERTAYLEQRTALSRIKYLLRPSESVGFSIDVLQDAKTRGWSDHIFFLDYDDLTLKTNKVIKDLYDFLEEPFFVHNFDHIEQVTREDDTIHGFVGLHDIRPKLASQDSQWPVVFDLSVIHTPLWKEIESQSKFWKFDLSYRIDEGNYGKFLIKETAQVRRF